MSRAETIWFPLKNKERQIFLKVHRDMASSPTQQDALDNFVWNECAPKPGVTPTDIDSAADRQENSLGVKEKG